MDSKVLRSWYLTKPQAISRYLVSVIRNWGFPVFWNPSEGSESIYLKICLGTMECPKSLHIRISNHSIPPKKLWIVFDTDLYCGYEREGATNYIKLISKLAKDLGRPLPAALDHIKAGTSTYREYCIEMQRRRKLAKGRHHLFTEDRFYV